MNNLLSWGTARVVDIAAPKKYALTGGPFGSNLVSRDYKSTGIPVIRGSNLATESTFSFEDFVFVSEEKADALLPNNAHPGDLIFTQRGTLGQVGLIPKECEYNRFVISQSQMKLTVDETKADPYFVYFYFRSSSTIHAIQNRTITSGVPHINLEILRNFEIPLPPLPTQQRIAEILSNYDRLIDNNTRRIALLEESIHRLYQEWFVYLRFPGCDRVKVVDGIPEGWSRMPFGDALILQRGFDLPHKDRKPGSIPVYASTGINGFHNVAKVKAPGIVTGRSGSLGSVMYIQQDFWALNTTLWVKEFKQVTVPFAYFLLSNLDLASYQGGSAVPTLNRNAVHAVEITVPDMNIQQKFDEIVHPVFKQIETFNRYNEKLREARDLLLPRLMNGSIPV